MEYDIEGMVKDVYQKPEMVKIKLDEYLDKAIQVPSPKLNYQRILGLVNKIDRGDPDYATALEYLNLASVDLIAKLERTNELIEIENGTLTGIVQDLEQRLQIDLPTGLKNKEKFKDDKETKSSLAIRGDYPLAAITLDLDYFSNVNNTYGHLVGDIALKQLADILRETSRKTDEIYRTGGEEFYILAPSDDEKGAFYFAEKIREAIQDELAKRIYETLKQKQNEEKITMNNVKPEEVTWENYIINYEKNKENMKITASMGIAVFRRGDFINTVIETADKELYKAKKSGRNRVMTKGFEPDLHVIKLHNKG